MLAGTMNPKAVLAAVLLLVMAVLWLRVFLRGRSGPEEAQAQSLLSGPAERSAEEPAAPKLLIEARPLPVESERHGRTETNPFVFAPAKWFPAEIQSSVSVQEPADSTAAIQKGLLEKIAGQLLLQAVIKDPGGVPVQVCVNGVVLSRGGTLKIREKGEIYELRVREIGTQEVQFDCLDNVLTVKMPSSEWLD
ncbi:MAG: hypothetical protein WHS88_04490 [Anaerohalosphaeraceae bacterium]